MIDRRSNIDGVSHMTAFTEHALWVASVCTLGALFGWAAKSCWAREPLLLIALPIPFVAALVAAVLIRDRYLA